METLNSIMFEKFMDGEISMDSYEKMLTILCESSASYDELMGIYKDAYTKLKLIANQVKKEIAASKFKDASKHLDDMNKVIDDSIAILKNIDKDSGDSKVAKIVMNALPSAVYGAALTLLSAVSGQGKIFTAVLGGVNLIAPLTSVVSDLKELKTTGDVTSAKLKNIIKVLVSFKAVVRKLSSVLTSKKLEAELKSSDLFESTVDDASDVITNLYIEGVIDDETYIDLMTESDDEDDATECYDKAIEILTKLKEKPGDKKLTEKLKDVLDDCCECDEKDDKKEDEKSEEKKDDDDAEEAEAPAEEEEVAEESTIVIESEDPVVAEIMESVEAMVADLDYASAIMESDLMMTESVDVLKSVMTDVKARLAGVGNMLKELKAKVVDVSDNGARAKIAKILNDLAKRFTALAGTAKEKIAGLANASKKTPDAPNA